MKRILPVMIFFLSFCSPAKTQTITENPSKPLSKNAGRIVILKEVLKITDQGAGFYFKHPELLHIGLDGSIFVADENQLLQFDVNGKLLRNYFKQGQGPGELSSVDEYFLTDKYLVVYNAYPSKIVLFDFAGRLIKDFALHVSAGSLLFRCFDGHAYYFISSPRFLLNEIKGMEAVLELPQTVMALSEGAGEASEFGSFPSPLYAKKAQGGGAAFFPLVKTISIPYQQDYLFISHTQKYLVKMLDLKKKRVIRAFTRKYERIKTPPEDAGGIGGTVLLDGKPVYAPAPKFRDDIVNLFVHDENLWVARSTREKGKGALIDVYSFDGIYTDCFYLPLPEWPEKHLERPDPHVVSQDFLYAIEKSDDDTYAIKKYKIGN